MYVMKGKCIYDYVYKVAVERRHFSGGEAFANLVSGLFHFLPHSLAIYINYLTGNWHISFYFYQAAEGRSTRLPLQIYCFMFNKYLSHTRIEIELFYFYLNIYLHFVPFMQTQYCYEGFECIYKHNV